jgi:hypothetical protein
LCALVLGKALLWFIYCNDAVVDYFIPEDFKYQIKTELGEILTALGADVELENFNPFTECP